MIRLGKIDDIPSVVSIGRTALKRARSPLSHVDRPTVFRSVESFISSPDKLFLVGEHDGKVSGFIMAMCVTPWWDDPRRGGRYVTDFAFCSTKAGDGARMLAATRKWAWTRPRVREVVMAKSLPGNDELADKLYMTAGYDRVGGVYVCTKEED